MEIEGGRVGRFLYLSLCQCLELSYLAESTLAVSPLSLKLSSDSSESLSDLCCLSDVVMLRVASSRELRLLGRGGGRAGETYQWLVVGARSDSLARCADCARTRPLQLEPRSPIRLVTGLRPPPRPITGPRLEYRVRLLCVWCWYVLIVRCAALKARVVGGL